MENQSPDINSLWSSLIIDELVRNGVNYFCISPGSRSTPLTVAAARNAAVHTTICYDERGSAFHALGYARACGKPAAVIATSGTAAANFYPAIIEASVDCIPLIVLTADRPPELRSAGANQTIDQAAMYGGYTRWQFDLPCPDENIPPEAVLTTVDQAAYRAVCPPAGPVHLNCMFREPLAPGGTPVHKAGGITMGAWRGNRNPYTDYVLPRRVLAPEEMAVLVETVNMTERGLLVIGRTASWEAAQAAAELARKLGWPVYADITSGLRTGTAGAAVIPYCCLLPLSEFFVRTVKPELALHIGGRITSKRFLQFLEGAGQSEYIAVADHPFRHDPVHRVTRRYEADISAFCRQLAPAVRNNTGEEWLRLFMEPSHAVGSVVDDVINEKGVLSEIAAARLVSRHIPEKSGLFLASSMPVRDMDMYAAQDGGAVTVGANRGASGIDGTIASAAGFAAGLGETTTLVIGDLAAIHDLNSLALLKSAANPVIAVVVNNGGGGIFSFLPIAQHRDVFERYFKTPHSYHFDSAAAMFGIGYYRPGDAGSFVAAYRSAVNAGSPALIEVVTDAEENYALHRELEQRIVRAVDKAVRGLTE